MLALLGRKWWITLLQGIILIVLAIYIFNHPAAVLTAISFGFGWMVLLAGIIGVIAWLGAEKPERENMSLAWSLLTVAFGLLLLLNLLATIATIAVFFGIWMLFTGVQLFQMGWSLKNDNSLGWVMVIAGALSIITGIMMIFNIGLAAIGISTVLGLQVLLAGIALVIFSLVKKNLVSKVKIKDDTFKAAN